MGTKLGQHIPSNSIMKQATYIELHRPVVWVEMLESEAQQYIN